LRSAEDVKKDIEKIENQIFMEKMADFMDWENYFRLNHILCQLQNELKEVVENERT